MTTLKLVIALIVSVSALDNVELVQTSPSRRIPDDTDNAEPIDADVDTEADKMASSPQKNDDGVGNADFDMEDPEGSSQQDNGGLDDEPSASQQNDDGKLDDEPSPGQESDDNLDDPNFDSLLQLTSQQEPKDDVDTEADKLADAPQSDDGKLDDEPSASQESTSQNDDGKLDDEPTPGQESDDKVDDPNFDSLLQLTSRQEPKDDVDTEADKLANAPQNDNGELDDEPSASQQSASQSDEGKLDDEPTPGEKSDDNVDDPNFDSLLQLTSRQEPKDDVDIEADKLADAVQKDNGELDDEPSVESAPQNDDVKLDDEPSASQESDDNLDDPSFDMA